jgi:hypothetical protein
VYAAAGLVAAVQKTRNPAQVLLLVWCFGLLHASYGVGYLRGVWRFLVLRKKPTVLHGTLTRYFRSFPPTLKPNLTDSEATTALV